MMNHNKTLKSLSTLVLVTFILSSCDKGNMITPYETPTPTPTVIPSVPVLINDSVPIISEEFRIDFGPGTKGITYFGPGTKGVSGFGPGSKGVSEFGPGSKGVAEFGPGTKGVSNLRFNINFSENLTNSFNVQNFAIKNNLPQDFALNKLNLVIKKGSDTVAKIQTLPTSNNITFTLDLQTESDNYSDTYEVLAQADNTFDVLEEKAFVKLESNTEIKVTLYAEEKRREDLDIAIRTKPIKSRIP